MTANAILHGLEVALANKSQAKIITSLHDELLSVLKSTRGTPDWDLFPLARTYFTQNWP